MSSLETMIREEARQRLDHQVTSIFFDLRGRLHDLVRDIPVDAQQALDQARARIIEAELPHAEERALANAVKLAFVDPKP